MLIEESLLVNFETDIKIPKPPNFNKVKWKSFLAFEAFGVKIGIRCNKPDKLEEIREGLPDLLPVDLKILTTEKVDFLFTVYFRNKSKYWLQKADEEILDYSYKINKFDQLDSKIRLTIAEFAENFIFLHAGVVSYKGKAIIIPARSFSGKTTLVAAMIKKGLEYYSDEYAVIDEAGLVHPFPKKLSMRGIIDDYRQVDIPVEELGGKQGFKPIEVGAVLISKYNKKARFNPKIVSIGEGIIESIANSVSIRQNPKLVLSILSKITASAKIIKTQRGEAEKFSNQFTTYLDRIGY